MRELAESSGMSIDDPWHGFDAGTAAANLCRQRSDALRREPVPSTKAVALPTSLGRSYRTPISTQAVLGRLLGDLPRDVPQAAAHVVTCSPDVASSTNLGGWINKSGVWAATERPDWFADDTERLLRWSESEAGQHIEIGIAEVNVVGLLGELGATWSRWGKTLIPIATLYDPLSGGHSSLGRTASMPAVSRS